MAKSDEPPEYYDRSILDILFDRAVRVVSCPDKNCGVHQETSGDSGDYCLYRKLGGTLGFTTVYKIR